MKIDLRAKRAVTIVALFSAFLLCALIVQFFRLQILQGDYWTKVANNQHHFDVQEPFQRGRFLSNTSIKQGQPQAVQPLVSDVRKYHLYIDALSLSANVKEDMLAALAEHLGLDAAAKKTMRAEFAKASRSRRIAMWLDQRQYDAIIAWWRGFATRTKQPRGALFFQSDYQRSYPFGVMAGQLLHTVRDCKDEVTRQGLPTGGLELTFNNVLKGKLGHRRLLRSPRRAIDSGEVYDPPQDGADVYLTINHYLQQIAEEEIQKGVKKYRAKNAWILVMDPYNGHVLACAQAPSFDPANYSSYFNSPEKMDQTRLKAVIDAQEPGSTFKALSGAIALIANDTLLAQGKPPLFDPEAKLAISNGHFPGRNRALSDSHGSSWANLDMGMQHSSNIYFARLIQMVCSTLGEAWYRQTLQDVFGIGLPTHIEYPAESAGLLPRFGAVHKNGALEWSKATPYSMAIGHNVLVTSMQMVRAYAVFANGGYLVEPTFVRKILRTDADGTSHVLLDNTRPERQQAFKKVLDAKIIARTVRAMKFVTMPGGTATASNIPGYTQAGKTGTSEKVINGVYSKGAYYSGFCGFAPCQNPRFVVCVGFDEPAVGYIPGEGKNHNGGHCAAPVFRDFSRRALQYLGVAPDDPYGYPKSDPRSDPSKADWVKEVNELRELSNRWNQK